MFRNLLVIIILFLSASLVWSQNVNIINIQRTGNFLVCANSSNPIITAEMLTSNGSAVVNGDLVITDPCGFTTLKITMSNLKYYKPSANWLHGIFFPDGENIQISDVNLPAGWIPMDTVTGASCSAGVTGGSGFYFDGTSSASWCCTGNPNYDGDPSNNYGDSSLSCDSPFSIQFYMTFCNSKVESGVTDFTLTGTSDGYTGCYSTFNPDGENNTVKFALQTIASDTPLFTTPASNTENITECFNAGADLNYIAVLEAECGSGDDVTWWDAAEGGNLVGTGSPFMYDPPGAECPAGKKFWASCCPDGEGCERKMVVIGHCMPPSDLATFDPIEPQCPGDPNPLPATSLEGVTGNWSPSFNPFASGTYTFVPHPGQCSVYPVTVDVEILPMITITIPEVEPICQFSTPPALPDNNEGVDGTWSPAVIDTSTPGTFQYTFSPEGACANNATIEITIEESIVPEFILETEYCAGTEIITLPTTSDNGYEGTWSPSTIDTSQTGTVTYTFTTNTQLCADTFEVDIIIVDNVAPTFPTIAPICQNSPAPALPNSNEGLTGTWSPSTIDTSVAGTFDYTFTPDLECSLPATIQITVTADIVPEFAVANNYCQFETPDNLNNLSNNGIPGTWSPAVIDTNTVGTTIYTFTPESGQCSSEITLNVQVFAQPVLNSVPTQILCDENFDNTYIANLNSLNAQLGGGTGMTYIYYASQADLNNNNPIPAGQTNNYQMTNLPVTIFAVGVSGQTCRSEAVPIQFNKGQDIQHATGPFGPIEFCQEDGVDLSQFETQISTENGVDFSYYNSMDNARNQVGQIMNFLDFTPSANQTSVFVRLGKAGLCSSIVEIKLKKLLTPGLTVPEFFYICDGDSYEVTATSDDPMATFEWTLTDGTIWTGATQIITDPGVYQIVAYSGDGCRSETKSLTVSFPANPVFTNVDVSGTTMTIGASNNGEGSMEYSLDGVFWQNSNVFYNLIPGETYTVWVRSNNCMSATYTITILSIPNFFSPNGDGINDIWEIRGLESTPNATLKIFDRYGKIFVDTHFDGNYVWDGRYMGRTVPSGDYWYIIHIPAEGLVAERKMVGHVTVRTK